MDGFTRYDDLQDAHQIVRVEEPGAGYYIVLDREMIVAGLQDVATFSSRSVTPLLSDPTFAVIPIMLDPPTHTKWRRLLASYFAVRRVPLLDQRIRATCARLLDEIEPPGNADFVTDFAFKFPTTIFLEIMGLPAAELDMFLEWEHAILHPGPDGTIDRATRITAIVSVLDHLRTAVAACRSTPPDPQADDILSHAARWQMDGEPVSDEDILSCCLLLFMAGLDTVASALSLAMRHLALHPEDRAWLAADPARAEVAAEELMRVYSIGQLARKVRHDTVFAGEHLREGDMVLFPIAAANRDTAHVPDARHVDFNRAPVPHYTFGAGPHRCLGSHLARHEMSVALEQWHRRIPDYEVATTEPLLGYWGSTHGVVSLPIRWR